MEQSRAVVEGLAAGRYDRRLEELYVDKNLVSRQRDRYIKAVRA